MSSRREKCNIMRMICRTKDKLLLTQQLNLQVMWSACDMGKSVEIAFHIASRPRECSE